MAGLNSETPRVPASQQFAAVAWLRWRLFRNSFRRKGSAGELIAKIIVYPIAALFILGPVAASLGFSYLATANRHLVYLPLVFGAIFLLQIITSINISPPGLSFDPESLIRYPLDFPTYLTLRLFFGLLSASTVVGTLALLAAAAGITAAAPHLWLAAFAAALLLALANMLFTRMVFAWVDRWLSTRRAREALTVFAFVASIGIQYLNVTFNNLGHRSSHAQQAAKIAAALALFHRLQAAIAWTPFGLAGSSIADAASGASVPFLARLLGVILYAALFLAIVAWRFRREFSGENLSEGFVPQTTPVTPVRAVTRTAIPAAGPTPFTSLLSPIVRGCLAKEWIYVRRNPAQLYGMLAPLAMVLLFAGRIGRFSHTAYVYPSAAAYAALGVSALAYNILGADASGVQFYFLAPIRFREVLFAKNLFGFAIMALQLLLLYLILSYSSGPPALPVAFGTLFWAAMVACCNAGLGNIRSLRAPKRVNPTRVSRRQTSQLSALLALGVTLLLAGITAGLFALADRFHLPWLPVPVLLAGALAAFAFYRSGLHKVDMLALDCREILVEELSKVSA